MIWTNVKLLEIFSNTKLWTKLYLSQRWVASKGWRFVCFFSVGINIHFCQCTAGCHTVQGHGLFWLKTYYGVCNMLELNTMCLRLLKNYLCLLLLLLFYDAFCAQTVVLLFIIVWFTVSNRSTGWYGHFRRLCYVSGEHFFNSFLVH